MKVLDHDHDTKEWLLFVDSSKVSLKAVLLRNGNKFPSIYVVRTMAAKKFRPSLS
jgi:hypothetical protein